MNRDCKKALARLAKLCRENIAAFGPTYDPRWPRIPGPGAQMKGAKFEGNGVTDMAREILTEIRLIRRENRRRDRGHDRTASDRIAALCHEGLRTDGAHHKQWYLSEILALADPKAHRDYVARGNDAGMPP